MIDGIAKYIMHGGEQSWSPPVIFKDAAVEGFVLRGDCSLLQALVDKLLNGPSGGAVHYRVLSDYVVLYFADFPHSYFKSTRNMGWSSEGEVGIWVPVFRLSPVKTPGGSIRLGCFSPYVFVDNPVALTTGREVYGFFKEFGWIGLSPPEDPIRQLTLDALAAQAFSPQTQIQRLRLLSVQANAPRTTQEEWTSVGAALRRIAEAMELREGLAACGVDATEQALNELLLVPMPLVFLKQFRAITESDEACYQAVTQAQSDVTNFQGCSFEQGHQFRLIRLESHPLAAELGLYDQPTRLAFRVQFDMTFLGGELIWKAGP